MPFGRSGRPSKCQEYESGSCLFCGSWRNITNLYNWRYCPIGTERRIGGELKASGGHMTLLASLIGDGKANYHCQMENHQCVDICEAVLHDAHLLDTKEGRTRQNHSDT